MDQPQIIDQTENWLVCVKPAGWLSVPSRLGRSDARPCLGYHLERLLNSAIYPVHRLDLEVSGLILFALNPKAHRYASIWFEQREVKKTYSALTTGGGTAIPDGEQSWTCKLLRGKKRAYISPHGKDCLTKALVVHSEQDYLQWQLNPVTGRPHQLRFELSRHQYPIIGDSLYGSTRTWSQPGIALRCIGLDFSNCSNHELLNIKPRYELPHLAY